MPSTRKQKEKQKYAFKWGSQCKCTHHKQNTSNLVKLSGKQIPKWKIAALVKGGYVTIYNKYICEDCLEQYCCREEDSDGVNYDEHLNVMANIHDDNDNVKKLDDNRSGQSDQSGKTYGFDEQVEKL